VGLKKFLRRQNILYSAAKSVENLTYFASSEKSTVTMASYVGNSFGDQDVDKLVCILVYNH
jgi:hypothetical protein